MLGQSDGARRYGFRIFLNAILEGVGGRENRGVRGQRQRRGALGVGIERAVLGEGIEIRRLQFLVAVALRRSARKVSTETMMTGACCPRATAEKIRKFQKTRDIEVAAEAPIRAASVRER